MEDCQAQLVKVMLIFELPFTGFEVEEIMSISFLIGEQGDLGGGFKGEDSASPVMGGLMVKWLSCSNQVKLRLHF